MLKLLYKYNRRLTSSNSGVINSIKKYVSTNLNGSVLSETLINNSSNSNNTNNNSSNNLNNVIINNNSIVNNTSADYDFNRSDTLFLNTINNANIKNIKLTILFDQFNSIKRKMHIFEIVGLYNIIISRSRVENKIDLDIDTINYIDLYILKLEELIINNKLDLDETNKYWYEEIFNDYILLNENFIKFYNISLKYKNILPLSVVFFEKKIDYYYELNNIEYFNNVLILLNGVSLYNHAFTYNTLYQVLELSIKTSLNSNIKNVLNIYKNNGFKLTPQILNLLIYDLQVTISSEISLNNMYDLYSKFNFAYDSNFFTMLIDHCQNSDVLILILLKMESILTMDLNNVNAMSNFYFKLNLPELAINCLHLYRKSAGFDSIIPQDTYINIMSGLAKCGEINTSYYLLICLMFNGTKFSFNFFDSLTQSALVCNDFGSVFDLLAITAICFDKLSTKTLDLILDVAASTDITSNVYYENGFLYPLTANFFPETNDSFIFLNNYLARNKIVLKKLGKLHDPIQFINKIKISLLNGTIVYRDNNEVSFVESIAFNIVYHNFKTLSGALNQSLIYLINNLFTLNPPDVDLRKLVENLMTNFSQVDIKSEQLKFDLVEDFLSSFNNQFDLDSAQITTNNLFLDSQTILLFPDSYSIFLKSVAIFNKSFDESCIDNNSLLSVATDIWVNVVKTLIKNNKIDTAIRFLDIYIHIHSLSAYKSTNDLFFNNFLELLILQKSYLNDRVIVSQVLEKMLLCGNFPSESLVINLIKFWSSFNDDYFIFHIHSLFILMRPTPIVLSQVVISLLELNRPNDAFSFFFKYRPYMYSYIFDIVSLESPRFMYSGVMIEDSYFSFKKDESLFKQLETDEQYFVKVLNGFAGILKTNRKVLNDKFWADVYKLAKASNSLIVSDVVKEIDIMIKDPTKYIKPKFEYVSKSEELITSLAEQRPSIDDPFLDGRPDLSNSAIPDIALEIYDLILKYYIDNKIDNEKIDLLVRLQASDIISFHNSLKDKRLAGGFYRCSNLVSSARVISTFFRKSFFLLNDFVNEDIVDDPTKSTILLLLKNNCENINYLNINLPYIEYCFGANSTHDIKLSSVYKVPTDLLSKLTFLPNAKVNKNPSIVFEDPNVLSYISSHMLFGRMFQPYLEIAVNYLWSFKAYQNCNKLLDIASFVSIIEGYPLSKYLKSSLSKIKLLNVSNKEEIIIDIRKWNAPFNLRFYFIISRLFKVYSLTNSSMNGYPFKKLILKFHSCNDDSASDTYLCDNYMREFSKYFPNLFPHLIVSREKNSIEIDSFILEEKFATQLSYILKYLDTFECKQLLFDSNVNLVESYFNQKDVALTFLEWNQFGINLNTNQLITKYTPLWDLYNILNIRLVCLVCYKLRKVCLCKIKNPNKLIQIIAKTSTFK